MWQMDLLAAGACIGASCKCSLVYRLGGHSNATTTASTLAGSPGSQARHARREEEEGADLVEALYRHDPVVHHATFTRAELQTLAQWHQLLRECVTGLPAE